MMVRMFLGCICAGIATAVAGTAERGPFCERDVVVASGPWEMAQATSPDRWMKARVPGTVLDTLVANGVVPDPMFGLNNRLEDRKIPDLNENRAFYTATFRTKVVLPADFRGKTVWLRPEGINYRGELYLNGKLATCTAGMFARKPVDVTEYVRPGETNDLEVKVRPVDHPGWPKQKSWGAANGEWRNGGDGELGRDVTMLMSAGWDFTFSDGIRDRNAGIWKDITFFATGNVRLDAPYVRTALSEDFSSADLTLELDVHNAGFRLGLAATRGRIVAEVEGTDVRFEQDLELFRGERRTVFLKAKMADPKLWWPRNKGPQHLYTLKARALDEKGNLSDEVKVRFGVREFTSDQSGKDGARQFYVNRRKIFIRGTNWIPDAMLRCDDARMAKIMRLLNESGVNLVRLWAGGIAESDYFYQLCDEYGLMVWQEFWMTGDTRHPDDPGLYLDTVEGTVKRIRSHASLCHWVASNESTEVAGIEPLVKRLTGTTSWMMQSECDGVHDGSPYVSVNPMRHYEDTASARGSRIYGFNPEYGAIGLPSAENLRSFMPENLLWPMDKKAWNYREGGGFNGMTTTHHALVNAYGPSQTLEDYCRRSEAADYLQQRTVWECWNRARNRATGVLYWYENPPLPEIAVHGWTYDLEQTPMFFAQKRALAPLHVQYEYLSNVVSVASDVYGAADVTVRAEVYDFDSRRIWEKSATLSVPGETCVDAFAVPFGDFGLKKPHFLKLRLLSDGREIDEGFYWRSCDAYRGKVTMTGPCTAGFEALADLPKTKLETSSSRIAEGRTSFRVRNVGDRIAFLVKVMPRRGASAGIRYSDNWFSLLPGESREIEIEHPADVNGWRAESFLGSDDPLLVLHLDFNTIQMKKETVVDCLRNAAVAGYNAVLWEIENKVRWACCPECVHPEAFTKNEFREILAEAARLGLRPIPLMQTFGHAEYVLMTGNHPGWMEDPAFPACYCVSNPEVPEFQKRLLREYLDLFGPSVRDFHLGGDEAIVFGTCPKCRLRDKAELYAAHLKDVAGELRTRGVRPGIWADRVCAMTNRADIAKIPTDFTLWNWNYGFGAEATKPGREAKIGLLKDMGYQIVFGCASQSVKDSTFLPFYGRHRDNIAASAELVRKEGLKGFCVTSWSVHLFPKSLQYPLWDFAAKRFLSPSADPSADFAEAVRKRYGDIDPDALCRAARWSMDFMQFDARIWKGYMKPARPAEPGRLRKRLADIGERNSAGRRKLIEKVADMRREVASARDELKRTIAASSDVVQAAELTLDFYDAVRAALEDGEVKPAIGRTRAFYAREQTPGSAANSAALVWSVLEPYIPEPRPVKGPIEISAFYYPGTEHMPEWDMMAQTLPGTRPLLGWYDEGHPENIDWQIKWAVEHGISSFCVDWYWKKGVQRLDHWVKGFYRARFRKYLKWYMMYANHDAPGSHSTADQIAVTRWWIDHYFKTPEYYRIDGKPVVVYWSPASLDRDFIAEAAKKGETLKPGEGVKRALALSEKLVREAGLPGIHWMCISSGWDRTPESVRKAREMGFAGQLSYTMGGQRPYYLFPELRRPEDEPRHSSFDLMAAAAKKWWQTLDDCPDMDYWPLLPTGWNDLPRSFLGRASVTYGRTPEKFREVCAAARAFCEARKLKRVMVAPINEWQEGSYIEPNAEYGFAMYDALRDVFCDRPAEGWPENLTPQSLGRPLNEFPPLYRSPVPEWNFDEGTEGWYRQPYGCPVTLWRQGALFFVTTFADNFNIRQRVVPFEAATHANFRVRMKVTLNPAHGLGKEKEAKMRLKWGTSERPIIGAGCAVDATRSVASAPVVADGAWHEYALDLSKHPDWTGSIDELWFEGVNATYAEVEIDWMRFGH